MNQRGVWGFFWNSIFQVTSYDLGRPPREAYRPATVRLTVVGGNSNAPEFTMKTSSVVLYLPAIPGQLVFEANANDIDPNSTLTYRLEKSNEEFDIDSKSGSVFVGEAFASHRFERRELTVAVSDGRHETTTNVVVAVNDSWTDDSFSFGQQEYQASVLEGGLS